MNHCRRRINICCVDLLLRSRPIPALLCNTQMALSPAPPSTANINRLDDHLLGTVFTFLSPKDVASNVALVCKHWRGLAARSGVVSIDTGRLADSHYLSPGNGWSHTARSPFWMFLQQVRYAQQLASARP